MQSFVVLDVSRSPGTQDMMTLGGGRCHCPHTISEERAAHGGGRSERLDGHERLKKAKATN
jgi:hypothetical protein